MLKLILIFLIILSTVYSNTNTSSTNHKSEYYQQNTTQVIPYDGLFFSLDYADRLMYYMNEYPKTQKILVLNYELR